MRFLALILSVSILPGLAGCQSSGPSFPKPDTTWKTHVGQLQYVQNHKSIIGDCVACWRGPTDFQLEFKVGPGDPLMRLWISKYRVRAEGALARSDWEGPPEKVPERLQGWIQIAEHCRTAPNRWRFEQPATAEHFAWASGQ